MNCFDYKESSLQRPSVSHVSRWSGSSTAPSTRENWQRRGLIDSFQVSTPSKRSNRLRSGLKQWVVKPKDVLDVWPLHATHVLWQGGSYPSVSFLSVWKSKCLGLVCRSLRCLESNFMVGFYICLLFSSLNCFFFLLIDLYRFTDVGVVFLLLSCVFKRAPLSFVLGLNVMWWDPGVGPQVQQVWLCVMIWRWWWFMY